MISQNEKIHKLEGLLKLGKMESIVSLLKDDSFKVGLSPSNPEFMYFMYKLYSSKDYKHASPEKAREMLNKSIQLKHPDACSEKGRNLLLGIDCAVDVASAEDSFRQSLSCEQSRYYIAEIYLKGMAKNTKGENFFDYNEAKEQLKEVVSMKGKFYKDALLKLAVIILKQESIGENDERIILSSVGQLSKEGGVEGHNARVVLGQFFLRQLKLTLDGITTSPPVDPDRHFDFMLLSSESSGLLYGVEANLERLSMTPDTI